MITQRILKTLLAFTLAFTFSAATYAEDTSNQIDLDQAHMIVDMYKAKRAECSKMDGIVERSEKMACYRELSSGLNQYQHAKRIIRSKI